jgi:hypothetical protein
MELVTHWIDWKEVYGRKRSRQRREIDRLLEARPMLMYLGDSWFSTPLYRNLAKQSAASVDGMGIVLGKPGGLASELFSEKELEQLEDRLEGSPFDALVISAGGNDSLSDRLEKVFADWMAERPRRARISGDEAFNILLNAGIFDDVHGGGILGRYRDLLQVAKRVLRKRAHFRLIGHTYAPLKRIGVPADLRVDNLGLAAFIKGSAGPWLWSVMQHVLHDEEAGRDFARKLLVDGFKHRVLDQTAQEFSGLFSYADFSKLDGIEDDAFWYDEIHPNEEGFARMASVLNDRIRQALPEAKQDAVR